MARVHWLALSGVPGIGGKTVRVLVQRFGDVEAIFDAPDDELLAIPRVTPGVLAALRAMSLDALRAELCELERSGINVSTWEDGSYPANLLDIADPPPVLFLRGSLQPADTCAVALVGTRHPDEWGVEIATRLGRELAGRGMTVVSGLALGIDAAAHAGALAAEGGRTLAVLGCGIRVVHPRSNVDLARKIVGRGAVLSELRADAPPTGPNLMRRDRIVSGLARATVVVQAQRDSGSVDTAERALSQGRLVLAVPGSPGTDQLLGGGKVEPLVADAAALDELVAWAQRPDGEARRPPADQLTLF